MANHYAQKIIRNYRIAYAVGLKTREMFFYMPYVVGLKPSITNYRRRVRGLGTRGKGTRKKSLTHQVREPLHFFMDRVAKI